MFQYLFNNPFNNLFSVPLILLLTFAFLALGAYTDARYRRIEPWSEPMVIVLAMAVHALQGDLGSAWAGMVFGGLGVMCVMLPIYMLGRGALGGGDVKLVATLGILLGFDKTMAVLLISMCLALLYGLISGNKQKIPLGVSIFFAFLPIVFGLIE